MLTTLALVYFPLPPPSPASDPLLGGRRSAEAIALVSDRSSQDSPQSSTPGRKEDGPKPVVSVEDLDYVAMDRVGPAFDDETYVLVIDYTLIYQCPRELCLRRLLCQCSYLYATYHRCILVLSRYRVSAQIERYSKSR